MLSPAAQRVLPLRIVITDPVPGVTLRMQSGRSDLVSPTSASPSEVTFDFSVRVGQPDADGPIVFYGPFTQGPPAVRFVYINAGRHAGQGDTAWDRRAKIPLNGITSALVDAALAKPDRVLEVRIAGRGRDGGPVCASVRLAQGAWRLVPKSV